MWGALTAGLALFAGFIVYEGRASAPMLPLKLFSRRNFSVANGQTFAIYGGIGLLGFFVTIYLQQVAGYSALKSGVTGLVPTGVMFVLSARMGRLADRYGARPFLTVGPLLVACGFALMQRYGTSVSLFTDVLPALLVFSLGLSMTVAPLTATVLADASEADAGIASAVNNAIARTAGLMAVAAVGAVVSAHYGALLTERLGNRLPASSQAAVSEAKRHTFGDDRRARDSSGRPAVRAPGVGRRVRIRLPSRGRDRGRAARGGRLRRAGPAHPAQDRGRRRRLRGRPACRGAARRGGVRTGGGGGTRRRLI